MTRLGKILVVEDESILREILAEWLEAEGYQVLEAGNGAEALTIYRSEAPDAIATDVRMPVMDGLTLLQRLRTGPGPLPAVVLMSGHSGTTLRETYDLGVAEILPKPFNDLQFLAAIRRVMTPIEERLRQEALAAAGQQLRAVFSDPQAARESGSLVFGRGGFCMRCSDALKAGPVQFSLQFIDNAARIAGHGSIKWIDPSEAQVGVEIAGLESDSLDYGIRLMSSSGARSYIPRTSLTRSAVLR